MDTFLTPPALSAPSSEWLAPRNTGLAAAPEGAQPPQVFAEPPSLGEAPKGARAGALALAMVTYSGLGVAGLALALAPPPKAAPKRTVAVVLEAFDRVPPPPPAGLGGGARATASVPPAAVTAPALEQVQPVPEVPASPSPQPSPQAAAGIGGGSPGGSAFGVPGGVAGGVEGGEGSGQRAVTLPPRFDAAYLQNPAPEYPSLSKRLGEEGRVILRVLVSPEGLPAQIEIRQSSGHPRLDQAALGTVRQWRFTPARRGSERLAAWVLVPLTFQLET